MKDIMDKLEYKGDQYTLIFNFNVLEEIQSAYGTLSNWLEEAYGEKTNEPSAKALAFAIRAMVNEGIDIDNEEKPTESQKQFITQKQANRMLTEFVQKNGVEDVVKVIDNLMGKSLQGGENSKNE